MFKLADEINTCEVCGETNLVPMLDLGMHPLCDDLLPIGVKEVCKEYPINIIFCKVCSTAHQRYRVPKEVLFPPTYHYRSRFTADVLEGMADLVDSYEKIAGKVRNQIILDIGCNDGSLLDIFKKKGALTIGVEPTRAGHDALEKGHVIYDHYFNENVAKEILAKNGYPHLITFTNVFAHIENLDALLSAVKILIGPETILIIENHYLGAIIDRRQFDTFYHEHPRSYSLASFEHIAKRLESVVFYAQKTNRYGGNIRIFIKNKNTHVDYKIVNDEIFKPNESNLFLGAMGLAEDIVIWKKNKLKQINDIIKSEGSICAKAFPGRAAILIKCLGLTEQHISAVYEKHGSMKIGNYVPGTRIPILSDQILFESSFIDRTILNLAWHIKEEIENYLFENGFRGRVINIMESKDFD